MTYGDKGRVTFVDDGVNSILGLGRRVMGRSSFLKSLTGGECLVRLGLILAFDAELVMSSLVDIVALFRSVVPYSKLVRGYYSAGGPSSAY